MQAPQEKALGGTQVAAGKGAEGQVASTTSGEQVWGWGQVTRGTKWGAKVKVRPLDSPNT